MNPSGKHTHPNYAVPPADFRAQATGIGQTREASLATGARRAQRVSDCMTPAARAAVPPAEGYPAPTPMDDFMYGVGPSLKQFKL